MKDLMLRLFAVCLLLAGLPGLAHGEEDNGRAMPSDVQQEEEPLPPAPAAADAETPPEAPADSQLPLKTTVLEQKCAGQDRACIIAMLSDTADKITRPDWRDQTYRELAKTLAFDGNVDAAVAVVDKIQSSDTKAMTIRGIGMAVADSKPPKAQYDAAMTALRAAAEKIKDPPSYAIALTYIAMSQAFAGDNKGAWATAASMKNDQLRHKAYGETAEIQAENGDFDSAMKSIEFITSQSYRNKAFNTVAKILADRQMLNEATMAAHAITDPYMEAEALQYVLDTQKPRDIPHQ